jgi:hypothetical protein
MGEGGPVMERRRRGFYPVRWDGVKGRGGRGGQFPEPKVMGR